LSRIFPELRTTCAFGAATIPAMPVLTAGNTVYTHPVAKVMVSIPDALLERIDRQADVAGETRSGFLQRIAEREVEIAEDHRREEFERLLKKIGPLDLGGDSARLIREDRESH
jgi:HicB_like antitoxin of bacterial toxin-antitoxin system